MSEMPTMPDDYFADGSIIIKARDGTSELGFAITKESYLQGRWKLELEQSIPALLRAIWQHQHLPQEEKVRVYGTPTEV